MSPAPRVRTMFELKTNFTDSVHNSVHLRYTASASVTMAGIACKYMQRGENGGR